MVLLGSEKTGLQSLRNWLRRWRWLWPWWWRGRRSLRYAFVEAVQQASLNDRSLKPF
jgi:hypothetical protein